MQERPTYATAGMRSAVSHNVSKMPAKVATNDVVDALRVVGDANRVSVKDDVLGEEKAVKGGGIPDREDEIREENLL